MIMMMITPVYRASEGTMQKILLSRARDIFLANVLAVVRPSVVCLSVVCNVRASYLGG